MNIFTEKQRILLVDDPLNSTFSLSEVLSPAKFDVAEIHSANEVILALTNCNYSLLLLNLFLSEVPVFELISQIRHKFPELKIAVLCSSECIDYAVKALDFGANDFIVKSNDHDIFRTSITRLLFPESNSDVTKKIHTYLGFIGSSHVMQSIYQVIDSVAPSKATVFITGESGTGKEVCAMAIHQVSRRVADRFVAINCAAIPKNLMESELFGHIKGSFTGAVSDRKGAVELADGGTLFLDEICEMDLELQSKLLRFIQTGTFQKVGSSMINQVDVRFVCATNRDPINEVIRGNFREDLYYRLHVIPITLPPLRDRNHDIIEIANTLLSKFSVEEGKNFQSFAHEVKEVFLEYAWPGNVRQLQNVIRNIVVLNHGIEVQIDMLPPPLALINHADDPPLQSTLSQKYQSSMNISKSIVLNRAEIEPLKVVERRTIIAAINACDGNIPQAAGLLEVSPSTIYRKLQSWKEYTDQ